jgi:asparagine synthase (glutamine-hydrolysing)
METFYRDIHKLPAASFLSYAFRTDQLVLETYRQQQYPEVKEPENEEAVIEQFRTLLIQSVKRRLRSDVSIGTSLSGGLDSSSIVALCAQEQGTRYSHKAFTAVFPGFEKNEQPYAEAVARRFGLEQHQVAVETGDIPSLMERVMYYQEEPFSSGSVLAQFRVYEEARKAGVKVLLDGQGADETLAGYTQYYRWYWRELFRNKSLQASGERAAIQQMGLKLSFGWSQKAAALFPDFAMSLQQSRKSKQSYRNSDLNRDFAFENKRNLYYTLPAIPDLNGVLYYQTYVNGLEELLRLADRNSMASATEVRLPFLSYELVDFVFSLPSRYKIRKGWTKWLLRKAMENDLPEAIVWRKDKVGFEPPQRVWMQDTHVQEAIREGKRKLVDEGVLDASVLSKKIQPHTAYAAENREWRYWSAAYLFT